MTKLASTKQDNSHQAEQKQLHLLAEAMRIKAKGEPTVPLAEVKRRIAAKKLVDHTQEH